ncbi:OTU domain-containing protein [Microbulbifer variabilis]|uniref:OTU domain-containing protein n=1 Tax=Microbulbifer variabilis TaxID=266805 RepID=UPI001CFD3B08|nr:OTU domain-containing protein [Microbulbifer variabilis]
MPLFNFKLPKMPPVKPIKKVQGPNLSKTNLSKTNLSETSIKPTRFEKVKADALWAIKYSCKAFNHIALGDGHKTSAARQPESISKSESLNRVKDLRLPEKVQPPILSDKAWFANKTLSDKAWTKNLADYIKTDGAWAGSSGDSFPELLSHYLKRPINVVSVPEGGEAYVNQLGKKYENGDSQAINLLLKDDHFQVINNNVSTTKELAELFKGNALELADVQADGNCLFSAVCKATNQPTKNALELRTGLGDWVIKNQDREDVKNVIKFMRLI